MEENKRAHLNMIQGVVNRLANNSFLLKGWNVTIVSAVLALDTAKVSQFPLIYVAFLPAIAFWVLDGYFLHQERLFRKLYDHVRVLGENAIDFSMNTSIVSHQVKPWVNVIFSNTLLIFHGAIFIVIILALVATT